MRVRFTRPALADLEAVRLFITEQSGNAAVASRVVLRLIERSRALGALPLLGRQTDEPGVRVLIVPRLRFLVFYAVEGDTVFITHIRHASRNRARWS